MTKICSFLAATFLLLTLSSSWALNQNPNIKKLAQYGLPAPKQMLYFDVYTGQPWVVKEGGVTSKNYSIVWMPPSAQMQYQMIVVGVSYYSKQPGLTAQKLYQQVIAADKKICKEVKHEVLQTSKSYIVTLEKSIDCNGERNDTLKVTKLFNGKDAVYSISYMANNYYMQDSDVAHSTRTIKGAYLKDIN